MPQHALLDVVGDVGRGRLDLCHDIHVFYEQIAGGLELLFGSRIARLRGGELQFTEGRAHRADIAGGASGGAGHAAFMRDGAAVAPLDLAHLIGREEGRADREDAEHGHDQQELTNDGNVFHSCPDPLFPLKVSSTS